MTAVVDDNIKRRDAGANVTPKSAIRLVAHENLNAVSLVNLACRFKVNPVDSSLTSKILAPHVKATAAIDADLKDMDLLTAKAMEMPVIDVEVVLPFPNSGALFSIVKKIPQRISGALLTGSRRDTSTLD